MFKKLFRKFVMGTLIFTLLTLSVGAGFAASNIFSLTIDSKGNYKALAGDLTNAEVTLSSRIITASGENVAPTVKKLYAFHKISGTDSNDNKKSVTVKAAVDAGNYDIEYYQVEENLENFDKSKYTKVDEAIYPGDYVARVIGTGDFTGSCDTVFSVIGLRQNLVAKKTSPKIHLGYKSFKVPVSTDGDGTGFKYESSNSKVVKVTQDGTITGLKPGRETITVSTVGDKIYQPASVKITVTVYPAKTTFKEDLFAVKHVKKNYTKQDNIVVYFNKPSGVTRTKVQLSTSKDFKPDSTITMCSVTEQRTFEDMDISKKYYTRCCSQIKVTDDKGNYEYLDGYWSETKVVDPQGEEVIE